MPKLTVCIPTYNRARMFRAAMRSVMSQDYEDCEFLVLDDCSTDETSRVVKELSREDSRIRYEVNETNLDFARNLQRSLALAQGDYIVILADDDYLLPGAIREYARIFDEFPSVGVIMSNMYQLDDSGTKCTFIMKYFPTQRLFSRGEEALANLWPLATFISGIAIRKREHFADFPAVGIYPQLRLIGRLLIESDGYGLSKFCIGARVHSGQWGGRKLDRLERDEKKHVFSELPAILNEITGEAGIRESTNLRRILDPFLVQVYRLYVANKRITQGAGSARETIQLAFRTYPPLRANTGFLLPSLLSTLLPGRVISATKELARAIVLNVKNRREYEDFSANIEHRLLSYSKGD